MKIYACVFAMILAFSSCITFIHKQHKNIDCCKGPQEIKCAPGCQNFCCQASFPKKDFVQNQCSSKISPCQSAFSKKEVTVLEGFCKNLGCQSQYVKKEGISIAPCKNQCDFSFGKKEIVQACPPLNVQCQTQIKKSNKI